MSDILYGTSMPRKTRIDAHGSLHHIIARGIERKRIFADGGFGPFDLDFYQTKCREKVCISSILDLYCTNNLYYI